MDTFDGYTERLIDLSWDSIRNKSTKEDFIYVSQIFDMFNRLQRILKCDTLLNKKEMELIENMNLEKPYLKLYRSEASAFILRLVKQTSFIDFLQDRTKMSSYHISQLIIEQEQSKFNDLSDIPSKDSMSLRYPNNEPESFDSAYRGRQILSPPTSPSYDHKFGSYKTFKHDDHRLFDSDLDLGRVKTFNSNIADTETVKLRKQVYYLEDEIRSLKKHIEKLENQEESKHSFLDATSYFTNAFGKSRTHKNMKSKIAGLEEIVSKYQKEISKRNSDEKKINTLIKRFMDQNTRQEKLIRNLRERLDLASSNKDPIKHFLQTLPFIKEYYFYFKYRDEQKSLGLLILNIITLFLSTVILLNLARFAFLISINFAYKFFGLFYANTSSYIYDNYSGPSHILSSALGFSWWKEIGWLEYIIYVLEDNLYG